MAYSIFFAVSMLAFVLRHHGDKVPECDTNNSTLTNSTASMAETLTAFTLATYDTGTVELSPNNSEYDSLSSGFTDYPGNMLCD